MAPAANTNLALLEIRGAAAEMFTARATWGIRVIAEASRENMIMGPVLKVPCQRW